MIERHFSELKWPGSIDARAGSFMHFINRLLRHFRSKALLVPAPDPRKDMLTMQQAANLQLLAHSVLLADVPGEFVEVGCYVGHTSSIILSILDAQDDKRPFHVYDSFSHSLSEEMDVRKVFESNLASLGLPLPQIHEGNVYQTLPAQLPAQIAFCHIDLGVGGGVEQHAALITHVLHSIYPRLQQNGIMVFMDYHLEGVTIDGMDVNPGVRLAVDRFFADMPEAPITLFGGAYSHGYVRKL